MGIINRFEEPSSNMNNDQIFRSGTWRVGREHVCDTLGTGLRNATDPLKRISFLGEGE